VRVGEKTPTTLIVPAFGPGSMRSLFTRSPAAPLSPP
jgi:hypothetical protein